MTSGADSAPVQHCVGPLPILWPYTTGSPRSRPLDAVVVKVKVNVLKVERPATSRELTSELIDQTCAPVPIRSRTRCWTEEVNLLQ